MEEKDPAKFTKSGKPRIPRKKKRYHATNIRLRIDTADALDLLQWETGRAKSEIVAVAIEFFVEEREASIVRGDTPRHSTPPDGPRPNSALHDRVTARILVPGVTASSHPKKKPSP